MGTSRRAHFPAPDLTPVLLLTNSGLTPLASDDTLHVPADVGGGSSAIVVVDEGTAGGSWDLEIWEGASVDTLTNQILATTTVNPDGLQLMFPVTLTLPFVTVLLICPPGLDGTVDITIVGL